MEISTKHEECQSETTRGGYLKPPDNFFRMKSATSDNSNVTPVVALSQSHERSLEISGINSSMEHLINDTLNLSNIEEELKMSH